MCVSRLGLPEMWGSKRGKARECESEWGGRGGGREELLYMWVCLSEGGQGRKKVREWGEEERGREHGQGKESCYNK